MPSEKLFSQLVSEMQKNLVNKHKEMGNPNNQKGLYRVCVSCEFIQSTENRDFKSYKRSLCLCYSGKPEVLTKTTKYSISSSHPPAP